MVDEPSIGSPDCGKETTMRTRLISSLAIAALALSACGGGDDKSAAVDDLMESAEEAGLDLDRSCVDNVADKLSDDDLKALAEAGPDGEAELSSEGEALTGELLSCISSESMVDTIMAQIGDTEGLDEECLREVLSNFDAAELAEGELPDGVFDCITFDG